MEIPDELIDDIYILAEELRHKLLEFEKYVDEADSAKKGK